MSLTKEEAAWVEAERVARVAGAAWEEAAAAEITAKAAWEKVSRVAMKKAKKARAAEEKAERKTR